MLSVRIVYILMSEETSQDDSGNGQQVPVSEVLRAKNDFEYFATHPKFIDQDYYPGGEVQLKDYHLEWVEALEDHDNLTITAFTGSGKTTVPGVLYVLWKIFNNPGSFDVMIVADALDQSKKMLDEIKHHIEEAEYLKDLKPESKDTPWARKQVRTSTGNKIICKPYSESAKGEHVDFIIGDEAAEWAPHDIYQSAIRTRKEAKGGTICLISTPVHENDLMAKLSDGDMPPTCPTCEEEVTSLDDGEGYMCENDLCDKDQLTPEEVDLNENISEKGYWNNKYAVYETVSKEQAEESENAFYLDSEESYVEPLFPENFDKRKIKNLREQDPTMFQKEYLCEPLAVEGDLYSPNDIIDLYDKDLDFHQDPKPECEYYMGCDFAVSTQGDYSVYTVIEVPRDGTPRIAYMERIQGMGLDEQEERIKDLHSIYDFRKIIVDKTNFGNRTYRNLIQGSLPVEGQDFPMKARNNLIIGLKNSIEKGEFKIPRKGERAQRLTDKLYEELLGFGTSETDGGAVTYKSSAKHDDTVMSLAMVMSRIDSNMEIQSIVAHN